jgi:3-hydroxyisobutyrate dehydrogenase-like beta-hydroxyacid dehydrogenase
MQTTIGFIGLGRMGEPMARNLLKAGYAVRVYNRTPAKAEALVREGAQRVARPADAVPAADAIVVTMLSDDRALEEVVLGRDGIGETLGTGGCHISMSTIAPATSTKLAAFHRQRATSYLAAPVFGRPDAAAARKLWICVSGSQEGKKQVRPVLEALGQGTFDFGEQPGAANIVKLAGNFLIAAVVEALGEALALAQKNGVERAAFAAMLTQTIFACPLYQNYAKLIAAEAYEPAAFKLALGFKDITLALDTAAASRVPMPLASLLHDRLLAGIARGRSDMDWAGIALAISEDAGLRR